MTVKTDGGRQTDPGYEQARAMETRETVEIRVRGTVQGVGFRPTVWRLARGEGLVGEVLNDGLGVLVRTTGHPDAISEFLRRLRSEAPPLSRIEAVETERLARVIEFEDFHISASESGENRTRVTPDAATCEACRDEVFNPLERRHRYPFANCTHCGPRFSIVKGVPYDRARTTMVDFPMCEECAAEYGHPADRRFHAQPIACAVCGPSVWLESLNGQPRTSRNAETDQSIEAVITRLRSGEIVAIRGLGGFHLACDATDCQAVRELRARKHRFGKPFALMARDIQAVRRYCSVTSVEKKLLESPEAPIVLLKADGAERLPDEIAPGLDTLGFMLPYTPLHLLIMEPFDHPLVMTSGNLSDEPQVTEIGKARGRLKGIADAALMHNRDIANRIDDSVVRIAAGQPRLIRRARGYAPSAVSLPDGFENAPDLLAYGGELKATFCLLKDGAAIVSQHQGDLEELATFEDYQKNLKLYAKMYDHRPRLLAIDLHPEYLSTKLAKERAEAENLPLSEIQHHHAHIASCMAENGVKLHAAPVLGIALDGLGFGEDGSIWGGEFLLADYRGYRRLGAFKPVEMPGGAQAIREPWRNTYAHLVRTVGWKWFADRCSSLNLYSYLEQKPLQTIDGMLRKGINVPLATSCGRLFDAVAAAVGVCPDRALFEGQGAMELEVLAEKWLTGEKVDAPPYPFAIAETPESKLLQLDPARMWESLLKDLERKKPIGLIAARFHRGLAAAIVQMVRRIRQTCESDGPIETVALSGGCFQNRILLEDVAGLLEADGLRCLLHKEFPANDGGLALGQAAIAAARSLADKPGGFVFQSTH